MKKWSDKKILAVGLAVIALCLIVTVVMMFANRSTKRMPTEAELAFCEPYAVNWQEATDIQGSDKEIILSLCAYSEKQTIGSNEYEMYTSETLGSLLHNFAQMNQLAVLNDSLYVQYTDTDGNNVTLTYNDAGLAELAVYFPETDVLVYQQGDIMEAWEKFRNGIQWGE